MKKIQIARQMQQNTKQIYDLICDVSSYPEFLPWCKAVRIIDQNNHKMTVDMTIGYKGVLQTYRSDITTLRKDKVIKISSNSDVFEHMESQWNIESKKKGSKITFSIDFSFRSALIEYMTLAVFDSALLKIFNAFEMRANQIYGINQ